MPDRKKLLVGVGFTESPEEIDEVLLKAVSIAKKYEARIYLIHVIEEMPRQSFYYDAYKLWEEFRDRAVKETLEEMSRYIKRLEEDFDDIEILIEVGDRVKKILEVADKIDADLIIVGHHTRKGIKHFVHSNTGEHILNLSKRPVLSFYIHDGN